MKKIGFMMLGMLFFLMGCQKEGTIAPEQAKTWTKEHLWMVRTVEGQPLTRAVAVKDKLWQAGDTIRIKFLPGGSDSPALEAKVQQYAAEWLQYAGLYFEYVDVADSADVKIGFDLDSRYLSWSVMGTDCRMVAQDECSLNFFELGMYGEEFDRAEVLRGFGHVLGLGFEHRSPESPIVFNSRAETFFKEDCRLTDQDVADLLALYNTDQTNYTDYDENSIMVLDLPRLILTTPHVMISSNLELSEMDKHFILELYPKPEIDSSIVTMITSKPYVSLYSVERDTTLPNSDIFVDWGDGTQDINLFTHTYADSAEHIIKFYGDPNAITRIDCYHNALTYLSVSKCKALERLFCSFNELSNIDVSQNLELYDLDCSVNRLKTMDISKNLNLLYLTCINNNLEGLNLTHNKLLKLLDFRMNKFQTIDVRNHTEIYYLGCSNNLLESLDVTGCTNLSEVRCGKNSFIKNDIAFLKFIGTLPNRTSSLYQGKVSLMEMPQNEDIIMTAKTKNWDIDDFDIPLFD